MRFWRNTLRNGVSVQISLPDRVPSLRRHASTRFYQRCATAVSKASKPGLPSLNGLRRQYGNAGQDNATIYALSTAPGTAAIAIIRISGAACLSVIPYSRTSTVMLLNLNRYIKLFVRAKSFQSLAMLRCERSMTPRIRRRSWTQML